MQYIGRISSWNQPHKTNTYYNNFTNAVVYNHVKEFINKKIYNEKPTNNKTKIDIFYKNQMIWNYKLEERILKNIVYENIKCSDSDKEQIK